MSELGNEMAELMSGIGERDRHGRACDRIAGEHRKAVRASQPPRVQAQFLGQPVVQPDQGRLPDGGGVHC